MESPIEIPVVEIKVCGIATPEGARAAAEAGVDWLGLVLAPSPRRMGFEEARALIDEVPARWVGVFVDAEPVELGRLARELGLAAIQLHGDETPARCRAARDAAGVPVWKALRWSGEAPALDRWAGAADLVLLDAGRRSDGRPPWAEMAGRLPSPDDRPVRLFLAGGLGPDNVGHVIAALRPEGVDASSRLETAPGVKDPSRVRAFVAEARAALTTRASAPEPADSP